MQRKSRFVAAIVCMGVLGTAGTASASVKGQVSAALRRAVDEALPAGVSSVRIKNWQVSDPAALRGARSLDAFNLLDTRRPWGRVTGRAELAMRAGGTRAVFVMAEVDVKVSVWIVSRRLGRDAPLGMNVEAVDRSMSDVPHGALMASSPLTGKVAARSLSRGTVLTERAVTTPTLIRRRDSVRVTVRSGPVMVQARGEALREGRLGERVTVRLENRKTVRGRVTGRGEVEIER